MLPPSAVWSICAPEGIAPSRRHARVQTVQQLLGDTSLERAPSCGRGPTIVSDLRIFGPSGDAAFQLFCNDLDEACKAIDAECNA